MREMRVRDFVTKNALLPTPHQCAQWMGVPQDHAVAMFGPLLRCRQLIDDIRQEPWEHWEPMSEDMRPPSNRMSLCGERHWCLKCAAQIKVIGNGWHVQAAAKILESVLRAVAKAKLGDHAVKVHDFAAHETHECKAQCRHRIKLKEVKRLLAARRRVTAKAPDDGIIEV